MNHPKELTFNEQYREFNRYDSIENIPKELKLVSNKKRGLYFVFGGIVLLVLSISISFTFKSISNSFSIFSLLGAFVFFAGGIYSLVSKTVIELKPESIQFKNEIVQWNDISVISKTNFQAFGGLTFKNLILEYSESSKLEFTYNFLNHPSNDIEQLIYLFWERGRKQMLT